MKTIKLILCFLIISNQIFAQTDSLWNIKPMVQWTGYMDIYYLFDMNIPTSHTRQTFLYHHNRHNEVNLNLGFLKASLEHPKYRANLALQAGTYVEDNYAAESNLAQHLFEANIGVAFNPTTWLDAGIFASHIGFESAVTADNWTLSRSLLAENSPYYLAGAKVTHTPSNIWQFTFLLLNGWQRIRRLEGNRLPSLGTQIRYTPNENTSLNWSTFLGTDASDKAGMVRIFNNFYAQWQLTERVGWIAGLDIGVQQGNNRRYDYWYSPVVIGQYRLNKVWKTAARIEYYHDSAGIIVSKTPTQRFQTFGISWNLDGARTHHLLWRIEGRWLQSQDKIFQSSQGFNAHSFAVSSCINIKF